MLFLFALVMLFWGYSCGTVTIVEHNVHSNNAAVGFAPLAPVLWVIPWLWPQQESGRGGGGYLLSLTLVLLVGMIWDAYAGACTLRNSLGERLVRISTL